MNNRQQASSSRITALYERLSQEDESSGDSNSIKNQKNMLAEYAGKNGLANPVHFTDDGYSGGNFDRPGWKRLIAEIEAGNVETVICKDMSRVGRDYLQVGFYTEVLFREKGVRFIAIANSIDSQNRDSGEFAPFLNIMSEWYIRDCSRKITAVVRTKAKEGRRLTNVSIYGYIHDPDDKEKWIIDPEAAAVVRRMFALTIDGKGPAQIARIFTEEKIECPAFYKSRPENGGYTNKNKPKEPYVWSPSTITTMLQKPEYKGHTVNCRTRKDSYKDRQGRKMPPEEWLIFENTHEAIVDAGTWETAQQCRKTTKRIDTFGEANPLTGKMLCADCGARMYNHRKAGGKPYQHWNGRIYSRPPSDFYTCSTKNNARNRFSDACSNHTIRTAVVRELILDAIRAASSFVKTNEAEFVRQVREASAIRRDETAKAHKKRLAKAQKRVAELNTLIKKLFEEHALGKLVDKRFDILAADYEQEQTALEQSIETLQAELDDFDADSMRADKFIEIVSKYTDFSELTPAMINEFVDRVVVYEADKSSGEREQKVDIYLNFIGKIDVPLPELTAEELAQEAEEKRLREQRRATQRKYVQKKRAECRAQQAAQAAENEPDEQQSA
ncbi:recombinase family protein [Ruminococcaceae bacterium OttesenSCG-928-L11]|nr:recombinase family protein [Ruminococcaceae bacterium OttesenSCG-928-L11]